MIKLLRVRRDRPKKLRLPKREPTAVAPSHLHQLDAPVPLSRSLLWRLQRTFFATRGPDAWKQGIVPTYVTTNPFIAERYARLIAAYVEDLGEPLTVVELGAGTGNFAFLVLKLLPEAVRRRVRYVVTDFTPSNVEFCRIHPALRPFVEEGGLDFAVFDAERDALPIAGPMVLVANYVFDTLAHDVFLVRGGELLACEVALHSRRPDPDPDDPELLPHVVTRWSAVPAPSHPYGEPALDAILADYRDRLPTTTIRFPIGAFRALATFRRLSGDRLLVLAADKGDTRIEPQIDPEPPGYAVHGSLSMRVNFHAIGEYLRGAGGDMLHTAHDAANIAVVAGLLGGGSFVATRRAFADGVERFGPDDFFVLKGAIEDTPGPWTFERALAFLRLARGDGKVLLKWLPVLSERVGEATPSQKRDAVGLLDAAWDLYYHLNEPTDLPFHFGTLLYELDEPRAAIAYFERSIALYGPSGSTLYNLALCHHALHDDATALRCARDALVHAPGHEAARMLCLRLQG